LADEEEGMLKPEHSHQNKKYIKFFKIIIALKKHNAGFETTFTYFQDILLEGQSYANYNSNFFRYRAPIPTSFAPELASIASLLFTLFFQIYTISLGTVRKATISRRTSANRNHTTIKLIA
jgi:hypothetical protein